MSFDFDAVGDDLANLLGSPISMDRGMTVPGESILSLRITRDSVPALDPHVFKISLRDVSSLIIYLR